MLVFSNIQTDAYVQGLPHISAPSAMLLRRCINATVKGAKWMLVFPDIETDVYILGLLHMSAPSAMLLRRAAARGHDERLQRFHHHKEPGSRDFARACC